MTFSWARHGGNRKLSEESHVYSLKMGAIGGMKWPKKEMCGTKFA